MIYGLRNYDFNAIKNYGKTFGFFELSRPVVVTTDLKFAKTAMIKDFGHFTNRIVIINFFYLLFFKM
jgi:hypothetical protein